jgi:nucleoside-diphosphate-sugar epimerase/phosphohistidine swiveling domain-containing protein
MRVLVTGGTGVFGRAVAERLTWLGNDVVAMARREQPLPDGVRFVAGDVRDAASVARAMDDCDVVIHTAWTVESVDDRALTDAIDLGGTANVLDAMEQTGTSRIVFTSSVTAYGSDPHHPQPYTEDEPLRADPGFAYGVNKALAEAMIRDRGVPAVIVRAAATLGRGIDNVPAHTFAGPALMGVIGETTPWQLVHQDDVARFCAEVAAGSLAGRTGTVNLAADDVLTLEELGAALGRPVQRLPAAAIRPMLEAMWRLGVGEVPPIAFEALRCMPVADTTRLHQEWGFRPVWSSLDTARDAARSMRRHVYFGKYRVQVPWRLPYPDPHSPRAPHTLSGAPLVPAAADGVGGEFDTLIDPRFDTFTATNLSEAFGSEPMTPLSLTISLDALQSTGPAIADQLALTGDAAHETSERIVGSFGHRIYLNVSAARETAKQLPGSSEADIDRQYLGIPVPEGHKNPVTARDLVNGARVLRRLGPQIAGLPKEMERLEREAAGLRTTADVVTAWSDEELLARIRVLHDVLATGWQLVTLANQIVGALTAVVERAAGPEGVSAATGAGDELVSANALRAVARLAAEARADPTVDALLREKSPRDAFVALGDTAPAFASHFASVLAEIGHRGPGETELENSTFADAPELLVEAIAKTLDAPTRATQPTPGVSGRARRVTQTLARAMQRRERIRDAVVVVTDALRLAVRERGRRLTTAGVLSSPGDVFYLAYEELLAPPADAPARVARRRAERERLATIRMPPIFEGRWDTAVADDDALGPGDSLTGIPAAPGVARGRVRVMREFADPLDPGDVLVANVTDTGWTPLFGFAGAVVTDVGGLVSHPAVVAREFGIPCVVGTNVATTRLRDGMMVEVDGTAGTVTVVDDSG